MDIIHGPSNLETETHHPHLSSPQEEEEVKRNWLLLPPDVMSLILLKLGNIDILVSAQWVCSSWWKLSKQPHLFRSIHVKKVSSIFGRRVYSTFKLSDDLAREAIDRSCGKLVEFSIRAIATYKLLCYMSEKSRSLRCLRLLYCEIVTDDGLTQVCKRFPLLEELELSSYFWLNGSLSESVVEAVGCLCPHLKSFRLNNFGFTFRKSDVVAISIAEKMPALRHLGLFGNTLTNDGLRAILHGCPHLQTLDLRRCFNLTFEGDVKEMSTNIKLRLPDDFEYTTESSSDSEADDDYYGSTEACLFDGSMELQ